MTHNDLPGMDPAFVAATIEALPGRLQKRLDKADPDSWTIAADAGADTTTVTVGTATVTLDPPQAAECDCLLSPRCLHLAQVLVSCPSAEAQPDSADDPTDDPAADSTDSADSSAPTNAPLALTREQLDTLELAESCLTGLLDRGLGGLTAGDRAKVLRVVAAARVQKLPLLAAHFARLHGYLGTGRLGYGESHVTQDAISTLVEIALATHQLRHGHDTGTLSIDAVGTVRRAYSPVGTLRLRGWACEPLLTASGYSGVITYLVDERDGRVWELSSVLPGDSAQIAQSYNGDTELGQLGLPHCDVARTGLLLTNATASADGRLGRGKKLRVNARTPDTDAVPAQDWWFGDAVLRGIEDDGLHPVFVFDTDEGPLRCQASPTAERIGSPALRTLASANNVQVQLRLRQRHAQEPGSAPWILIGVAHDNTWVFPGLDRPNNHWLGVPKDAEPVAVPFSQTEPETVLQRWRDAVARQGRRAVTGTNRERVMADATWLRSHASGHRADLLENLADAAATGSHDFDGRFRPDPRDIPRRWAAVAAVC
ncbi:hypothetical protein [uncultured Corynebacterium sp.]|uniref:hypothetical protein n=1 Tax=uncultured Corynebacterium sp. TaxID=159447 RepID=UPI0025EED50E|nr:hypothetical protein [uncultured Corynebacterium sp.]